MTGESLKGKKLVIKIGSSTLTDSVSSIDTSWLDGFAKQVSSLRDAGADVVVVSSGAIACGLGKLGMSTRPTDAPTLQAAASVGGAALVTAYEEAFAPFEMTPSIVLLTRRDTADRESYLHARDALTRLLELGVVPIVNENDTVSIEQIRFGDNDTLAALVACLIGANMLVILSDIDGLYDADPSKDPGARLLPRVSKLTPEIYGSAGGPGTTAGSGGMVTKIRAARVMMAAGIPMAIVHGKTDGCIVDTLQGACPGTLFESASKPHEITPRKLWIALGDAAKGALFVDLGAASAIKDKGASLLAVGVKQIEGGFQPGDIVDVKDPNGLIIARGVISASSDEVSLACGKQRSELERNGLLAQLASRPLIHRDDLVLFE